MPGCPAPKRKLELDFVQAAKNMDILAGLPLSSRKHVPTRESMLQEEKLPISVPLPDALVEPVQTDLPVFPWNSGNRQAPLHESTAIPAVPKLLENATDRTASPPTTEDPSLACRANTNATSPDRQRDTRGFIEAFTQTVASAHHPRLRSI